MRGFLNQSLNVGWTLLAFLPVILIWWERGIDLYFWVLLALSLGMGFVPVERYRISTRRKFYEKWGVKVLRRWVQDGGLVQAQTGAKLQTPEDAKAYGKHLKVNELFHWQCLLFFLGTALAAAVQKSYLLSLAVLVANYLYNFLPILLQQYTRLRLRRWL